MQQSNCKILCVRSCAIDLIFNQCLDLLQSILTHVILNKMIMPSKMNHCLCKGNEFVDNIVYFIFIFINLEMHTNTKFANRCAQRRIKGKMTCNKNLCGVTYPSYFIPKTDVSKLNTRVIFTLEVAQTSTTTKTQNKSFFWCSLYWIFTKHGHHASNPCFALV